MDENQILIHRNDEYLYRAGYIGKQICLSMSSVLYACLCVNIHTLLFVWLRACDWA